jgi:hypothetical protein
VISEQQKRHCPVRSQTVTSGSTPDIPTTWE